MGVYSVVNKTSLMGPLHYSSVGSNTELGEGRAGFCQPPGHSWVAANFGEHYVICRGCSWVI